MQEIIIIGPRKANHKIKYNEAKVWPLLLFCVVDEMIDDECECKRREETMLEPNHNREENSQITVTRTT